LYYGILGHWRRLDKKANQNIGGQKVGKMINAWAFLKYWGHMPGLHPIKSLTDNEVESKLFLNEALLMLSYKKAPHITVAF